MSERKWDSGREEIYRRVEPGGRGVERGVERGVDGPPSLTVHWATFTKLSNATVCKASRGLPPMLCASHMN